MLVHMTFRDDEGETSISQEKSIFRAQAIFFVHVLEAGRALVALARWDGRTYWSPRAPSFAVLEDEIGSVRSHVPRRAPRRSSTVNVLAEGQWSGVSNS
jgi:hypothetical protein